MTDFSNKCRILSELWVDFREDESLQPIFYKYDVSLPLAYSINNDYAQATTEGARLIQEVWFELLEFLDLSDEGFDKANILHLLDLSIRKGLEHASK